MWQQIGTVSLGIGASVAANLAIKAAVTKALSIQRRKLVAHDIGLDEEEENEMDFELIAVCELFPGDKEGEIEKEGEGEKRIFCLANIPTESGTGQRRAILVFKGEQRDEALEVKKLDGEFSAGFHDHALTPDELKVERRRKIVNEKGEEEVKSFLISFPSAIPFSSQKYVVVVRELWEQEQRKLGDWLEEKAKEEGEEEEEEEEEEGEGEKKSIASSVASSLASSVASSVASPSSSTSTSAPRSSSIPSSGEKGKIKARGGKKIGGRGRGKGRGRGEEKTLAEKLLEGAIEQTGKFLENVDLSSAIGKEGEVWWKR